jgi:hypothetical protein
VRAIQPPSIPAPSEQRITFDLGCSSCGYNLRTLEYAALCPECGQPVSTSLRRSKLASASPARLAQMRIGSTVLIVSMLAEAFVLASLFFLWPLLPAGAVAPGSHLPELFIANFGFGWTIAWLTGVWLITAPRQSGGRLFRRISRRDGLAKGALGLSLIPMLSTIATIVLVGDIASGILAFPGWDLAILTVSVAGSVSIYFAGIMLLAHLRTIVRREICKGLHLLLGVLILVGAIGGAIWTALMCCSEMLAGFFAYPPLSILVGIAVHSANAAASGSPRVAGVSGPSGSSSMLADVIALLAVILLTVCSFAATLWPLFWFRRLVDEALRSSAGRTTA